MVDLRSREGRNPASGAFGYLKGKYLQEQKGFWERKLIPAAFGSALFVALYAWVLPDICHPGLDNDMDPLGLLFAYGCIAGLLSWMICSVRRRCRDSKGIGRVIGVIIRLLSISLILITWWNLADDDAFFTLAFAAAFGAAAWGLTTVRARYTPKGRERLLQVQGLEMYIRIAETHRLAKINAPEDTVEKFEELLPYAVALGCAEAWQQRFDKVLLAANYAPEWAGGDYESDDARDDGTDGYSDVLAAVAVGASGLAAAVEAARDASAAARSTSGGGSDDSSDSGSSDSGSDSGSDDSSDSGSDDSSGGSSVGGW